MTRTRRRTRKSRTELGLGRAEETVRDAIVGALTSSAKDYESNAVQDPFTDEYGTGIGQGNFHVEQPPYNLKALSVLVDRSNMLRQCIDAYVANLEATGYTLEYIGEPGEGEGTGEESPEALLEKTRLENLLEQPNGEYGFLELRERNRRDYETIGAYAIEVLEDEGGEIVALYNLPVHSLRLTVRDSEATTVTEYVNRNGQEIRIQRRRRFRRYVQQHNRKKVYFKELGDPRRIDPKTGEENNDLTVEEAATSILYVPCYKPGYAYGVPRYIHQLPSILGSREAEEVNLHFFKENAIPAMAVLVAGGSLTEQSIEETEEYFADGRGRESMNRIVFIEAVGDEEAASEDGRIPPPTMQIKPLANERQGDALFKEYDEANQKKIRSAFRLNPMFVGMSDDMTHATAKASVEMTESQVFGPERNKVDNIINMRLLVDADGRAPRYWRLKSNPPRLADTGAFIEALENFDKAGAMTPNRAIQIANEVFNMDMEPIADVWGNFPFAVTLAQLEQGTQVPGFEDLLIAQAATIPEPTDPPTKPAELPPAQKSATGEPVNDTDTSSTAATADTGNAVRKRTRTPASGVRSRTRTPANTAAA